MFRVRPPTGLPEEPPGEANAALVSARSLMIIALSMMAASIIGLGAGLAAGVMAHAAGPVAATAIGCVVGLAAAITGGLTVASALHQVVVNKSG
ncbi:hypothetical protein [Streptosporangium roseum]|uniref:hypothetical protein n=1 Tax=Streptosporangium roseum TaxID=2001 RepID=UPI00341AF26A